MNTTIKLSACAVLAVAFALTSQAAEAAVPKIKGKYAYHSIEVCQIGVTATPQANVSNVNAVGSNHVGTVVGTINFTGANPNSGSLSFTQKKIEGVPLYVNTLPAVFAQTADSGSGTYSNTATTLTLAGEAGPAVYGNIVSGIAKTVHFIVRHNGNRCFESGTLTREN